MVRRQISATEERELIAAAESLRAAGIVGERANIKVNTDATAVLSVRLPIDQLRALRDVAVERHESVSALLQDAVLQLLTRPVPRVSATDALPRFWVTGAAIEPTDDSQVTLDFLGPQKPTTGGYRSVVTIG